MLFSDTYLEPAEHGEAALRERGSRFFGHVWPVFSEDEVREKMQAMRLAYPDATHHCYAYVLYPDKAAQKASDDGEPANSAGKPILRAILSRDLTNVLVVVVRYFGGTQLGIPGLIQSYGECAKMVLEQVSVSEKLIEEMYILSTDFSHEQEIHRLIQRYSARVLKNEYTDRVSYTLAVRRRWVIEFEKAVAENYLITDSSAMD
ncbi:MAG: YigZ family protein [Bacteroidetes bacterium]|nr:YigZ family protein [Bacteroidota bacterium]